MSVPRRTATFGSLLREHRLAAGLTQEALSERSGVSPRTIQEVEADHSRPRRSTVVSLIEALALLDSVRDELLRMAVPRPRRRQAERSGHAARQDAPELVPMPVLPAEEAGREPTLVALPRPAPTNLPWPVSDLLGREGELDAIRALLTTERQRLVTLTGVGGSGKTRLAIQVATDLLDQFLDGVWFVELAPTTSPGLVPGVVAGALGVREVQDVSILDALHGFLRRKRLLLVLDNCEHLVDACAELTDRLLTACPDLHILATSREPLQIVGERRWPVQPLAVPDLDGPASLDALAAIASVRLFVERARAIDPEFALTEGNAASVAQVCARLDGIPLAIELAASRLGVLEVEQIAERLDDAFRLLAGGTRTGPRRQQTLEAALAWSYDLLTPSEQATFRSLSVLAGGFDLEAAEAVCDGVASSESRAASDSPPHSQLATHNSLLDVLGRLVDKSLVRAERHEYGRRYRLLEPVRQYAHRQFLICAEDERVRARHAACYAALAERAEPLLHGPEQVAWLDRLDVERDNFRVALGWIAEHGEVDAGLRLATALATYWEVRGYLSEGRDWLQTFLSGPRSADGSADARLHALMSAGVLALWQGDFACGSDLLSETLVQAAALGDRRCEATTRIWLAAACRRQGDVRRALTFAEAGLRLGHELSDERVIALALLRAGIVYRDAEAIDRAVSALEESLERYRRLGDARSAAIAATMLGWALLEGGSHGRAAHSLVDGATALWQARDQAFFLYALRGLAYASHEQGEHRRAVRWYGASEALRVALGMRHPRRNQERDQTFLASVRARLDAASYEAALADGEATTFDQLGTEIVAAR